VTLQPDHGRAAVRRRDRRAGLSGLPC
jgi:hypothetical protein